MTGRCDSMRLSLGAYVLGALEPADRAEVESHVRDCPACQEELSSLAGLPGLLGRLDAAEVEHVGEPERCGQGALDRALTEVARHRRSRRRRWLAGAAAAVVIAAGGAGASTAMVSTGSDTTQTPAQAGRTVTATDPATGVHAKVTMRDEAAGTALRIALGGVRPGLRCKLVAVADDGHREVASNWRVASHGYVAAAGTTAIPMDDLASLRVVSGAGAHLVTVPVPGQ